MKEVPILKIWSHRSRGSTETENTIHFELHTFCTLCILAHPAAFISTWFHMTLCLWCHAGEKFCTLQYRECNAGIYNEVPIQVALGTFEHSLLNWTPSCTHTWGVHEMPGSLLVIWFCELPIRLCLSSSIDLITLGWEFRGCNHH